MSRAPNFVEVVATASELVGKVGPGDLCLVVDILRATTTILTALSHGARSVIPQAGLEAARTLAHNLKQQGQPVVLAGERGGKPLPGFDLGNSPLEFQAQSVRDKIIVLTTTNGTQALEAGQTAAALISGSFGNAQAVCQFGLAWPGRIVVGCAGQEGAPAGEDLLFAGWLVDQWVRQGREADPGAREARKVWLSGTSSLRDRLAHCPHGQTLIELGFALDVDFAAQWDTSQGIPRFQADGEKGFLVGTLLDPTAERMMGA